MLTMCYEQEIQIQLDSNPLLEKIEDEGTAESLTHLENKESAWTPQTPRIPGPREPSRAARIVVNK